MALATTERGRLKLNLDTSEEDMVDMAMVDTDVAIMGREAEAEPGYLRGGYGGYGYGGYGRGYYGKREADAEPGYLRGGYGGYGYGGYGVATMERGRLMLSLDILEEDMVDMAMAVMAMVIMVKCFNYLLAVSPLTNFSLAQ